MQDNFAKLVDSSSPLTVLPFRGLESREARGCLFQHLGTTEAHV